MNETSHGSSSKLRSSSVLTPGGIVALCAAAFSVSAFWSANAAAQTAPEATAAPAPAEPAAAPQADEPSDPPPMAEPPPAEPDEAPPAEANDHMLLVPQHERETGPRTFHRHDGFYLRTNFGLGTLWGGFTTTGTSDRHLDAGGSGIGVDLLVGGSPSPGFSIGGGLVGNWLFGAKFDEDGANSTSHDMSSGLVGVFVDGFPRPTGGWHLGGLLGLGGHTLNQGGVASKTGGFGGAIWSGYDQWVGDNFSVGGMLRFTAMRSTGTKSGDDIAASTATLSLMFTALYQ